MVICPKEPPVFLPRYLCASPRAVVTEPSSKRKGNFSMSHERGRSIGSRLIDDVKLLETRFILQVQERTLIRQRKVVFRVNGYLMRLMRFGDSVEESIFKLQRIYVSVGRC